MRSGKVFAVVTIGALLCCGSVILAASEPGATIYLDNSKGSDHFDGSSPTPGAGNVGPVATVAHACDILAPCGKLVISNTGNAYRGTLKLIAKGGTPECPLIVEGNDATLEGLEVAKPSDWTVEPDGILSMKSPGPPYGYFVVTDGKPPVWSKSLKEIKPGETYFDKHYYDNGVPDKPRRLYYRLPEGKRLEDVKLELPTGGYGCGVEICQHSNILIRNLKCRYFANDGFNLQFECEGVRFENIEAYLNGDQGFSCHGTVSCTVINSNFHENDAGIIDTVYSRTMFYGVIARANRTCGVRFIGGEHSLVNAKIVDNPVSLTVESANTIQALQEALPGFSFNPYAQCRLFLRNAWVQGGDCGLEIKGDSTVSANYCTFRGQPTGIILDDPQGRLHLMNSIVAPQTTAITCSSGQYWGDYNCWSVVDAQVAGRPCEVLKIEPSRKAEIHSVVGDPRFVSESSPDLQAVSPARKKAFVDPDNLGWLRRSGTLDPKYPPEQYPLMYPDDYPDAGYQTGH